MTETEVREFITHYFHSALNEADLDIFAGLFAEDAMLEDPVGAAPLRGRIAIREFVRAGRALISQADPTVHDIKVCGDECAVRWSVAVTTVRGATMHYDGIGIFMFAGPRLLRHVREYYDASQLAEMFAAG